MAEEPSKTIEQFCDAEQFSPGTYYELKRQGLGPEEMRPPGTRLVRITAAAHAAWRKRMAELSKSKEAKLELARRRAAASIAGRSRRRRHCMLVVVRAVRLAVAADEPPKSDAAGEP